jgi:hypothetical protein
MVNLSVKKNIIEKNIELNFKILEDRNDQLYKLKLKVIDNRYKFINYINLYESSYNLSNLFYNKNLNLNFTLNKNLDLYNIENNILNLNSEKYNYYNIINFNIYSNLIEIKKNNILNIFDKNYYKLSNILNPKLNKNYILNKDNKFINLNEILDFNLLKSLNILLEYKEYDISVSKFINLYNWNIISINKPKLGIELLNEDLSNILLSNINEKNNNNGSFKINNEKINIISNLIKSETTSNNYFIKIKKNINFLNEFYIKPEINYIYNYPNIFIENEYNYSIKFNIKDITILDNIDNDFIFNIKIKDSRLNLLSNSLVNKEIKIIFYDTEYNINDDINKLLNNNDNINFNIEIDDNIYISLFENNLIFTNTNYIEPFILNLNLNYSFKDSYLLENTNIYSNIIILNIIDLRIEYIFNSYIINDILINENNKIINFSNILKNNLSLLFPDYYDKLSLNFNYNNLYNESIIVNNLLVEIYKNDKIENYIINISENYIGVYEIEIKFDLYSNNFQILNENSIKFILKDIRFNLLNNILNTNIDLLNNISIYNVKNIFDIIEEFNLIFNQINTTINFFLYSGLKLDFNRKNYKFENYNFKFNSNIYYEKEFTCFINIELYNINTEFDLEFNFFDKKYNILLNNIYDKIFTTYIIEDNFNYNIINNLINLENYCNNNLFGFNKSDFNYDLIENNYIKIENNILKLNNEFQYSIYSNLIDLKVNIYSEYKNFKLLIYDLRYSLLLNLNLILNKNIINIYNDLEFSNLNLNKNQIIFDNLFNTNFYEIINNSNIEFNINNYFKEYTISFDYSINFDYIDIDLDNNKYSINLNIIDKRYNLISNLLNFDLILNIDDNIIDLYNILEFNNLGFDKENISFSNILLNNYYTYNNNYLIEFYTNKFINKHNIELTYIINNEYNESIILNIIDKRYNILINDLINNKNNIIIENNSNIKLNNYFETYGYLINFSNINYDYNNSLLILYNDEIIVQNIYINSNFLLDINFSIENNISCNIIFNVFDKRYNLLLNEITDNINNILNIYNISNISTLYFNNINKKGNIVDFLTDSEYFEFDNSNLYLNTNYYNIYIYKEFNINIKLLILEFSNLKEITIFDKRYDILLNEIKNYEVINLEINIDNLQNINYYLNNYFDFKGHYINNIFETNFETIYENNQYNYKLNNFNLNNYIIINNILLSNINNNNIYYYLPINILYYSTYYEIKSKYYLIINFDNY